MGEFDNIMDIQRNMADRLAREVQFDKTVELLGIVQSLVRDPSGRVAKEAILIEATMSSMLRAEADVLLRDLIRNNTLREDDAYVILTM